MLKLCNKFHSGVECLLIAIKTIPRNKRKCRKFTYPAATTEVPQRLRISIFTLEKAKITTEVKLKPPSDVLKR